MRKPFIVTGGVIISLFVFLILMVMPVGAVPPLPFTVYGRIQLNGADVADGTIIRAYVNGVERGSTTSVRYNNQSVYSLDVSDDPNWNPPGNPPATGQTITFTFNGHVASQTAIWQSGATQALTLTASGMTQTYQVSAALNDAHDRAGYCTTNLAKFGIFNNEGHTAGYRFTSITKPITATTVQSAYLRWTANSPASVLFTARIYAQKTASTVPFDCTSNKPSQRVKTGAFITYTVPAWATGNTYDSPNLAPLLNEVLAAAGSAWDKTFVLLVTYASGGISTRDPEVFDSDPANATRLIITWGSPCATPGTPTLVAPANGSVINDTTPTFRWNAASNANDYHVQIDNNADFSSPEKNFMTTRTDYTLAVGLAPGTYYWRVRGRNTSDGCNTYGPWSAVWTVVITNCATPGTPTLVAPANGSATNSTTPTFSWNAASNATRYQVQIDNNADFSSPEKNFYATGTSYKLAVGLTPATYYWRVRGQNTSSGCNTYGAWSAVRSLTICATPAAPALVSPVSGTVTADTTPSFSWSAVANATQYQVQIDNNADFSSPEKNFTISGTSYTLSVPLAPGTYHWRVRGRNAASPCSFYGPWSGVWTFTISGGLASLAAPTPSPTAAPIATATPTSGEVRREPAPTPTPTETPMPDATPMPTETPTPPPPVPDVATPTIPIQTPPPEGTPAGFRRDGL